MILKNGKRIDGCSDTVPIGSLNPFLGTTAPYGYLVCAGQLVSKTTYPELYAICGDTYGTATATEFYLPDLRGRTIVGYKEGDTNFGTLGGLVGSVTSATGNHTLTADESGLPSHDHLVRNNYGYIDTTSNSGTGSWGQKFNPSSSGGTAVSSNFWKAIGDTAQAATSAHNHGSVSTIQPSINLNWVVKAFMLMPNQSYVATIEQESDTNTYSCNYINNLDDRINDLETVTKITSGTVNTTSIPTGNDGAIVSSISLPAGTYIIQGSANGFSWSTSKWLQIINTTASSVINMINVDGVSGGQVSGMITLTQTSTIALKIIQYTGSAVTYTPHWADTFKAVRLI